MCVVPVARNAPCTLVGMPTASRRIIAHIGPNARQVAVGKQIVQEGVEQNG